MIKLIGAQANMAIEVAEKINKEIQAFERENRWEVTSIEISMETTGDSSPSRQVYALAVVTFTSAPPATGATVRLG